ncbi:PHP domain-containing protein [Propionimicrobium sp. PCR01-08-3]|uniref:PHP domain-containing protein n=1 Tax=Propionimicrobium sp. PCR01-08-3 TaxID=3052086 RepID=UPI00255CCE91|nr:PHP domain-containing protein [Propionimicrobium sp. PCR01-08-3]WIY83768.1 PHP domain-containing protein [Propionimicrobium sp. PCR01-08-3]
MRIDLHTHSWVSDGTDSPTRLVLNAQRAGLDVVALTDHDTLAGLDEAREAGRRIGVRVVPGVELSARLHGGDVHLLGYGPRRDNEEFNAELNRLRSGRRDRLPKMLAKLADLGMPLTVEDVRAQVKDAETSLGRPHVADAMVAKGYVANRDEAFAKYLDSSAPAYVSRPTIELAAGIDLLHRAGAAAVIAHPGIRGMDDYLTGDDVKQMAIEHGLDGIEVDYPLHDAETRELYHRLGERLGLVRTGSSDYHGAGKIDHDLGCETTRESALRALYARIRSHGGVTE